MNSAQLNFLSATGPSKPMQALQELSEFLGLPCSPAQYSPTALGPQNSCLGWILDVADLARNLSEGIQAELVAAINARTDPVLLLITDNEAPTSQLLRRLTGETIISVSAQENASEIEFSRHSVEVCRELSGVVFKRATGPALLMNVVGDKQTTSLMRVGQGTAFLAWGEHTPRRFAWSTPTVFDTARPLSREAEFEGALDSILPAIMALRFMFPEQCWQNPARTAAFVIDDPLLTPRYGYIDFPSLLESARREAYHVSLAFIPWNAWRTRKRNAALFSHYSDVFSLCLHGCDHNNNEYGSSDYNLLLEKNRIALARMERHSQRTGLACAPVAVCPQEQCSLEAWKAFADTPDILAMTNTGCLARNGENQQVCAQDLLLPAQDALYGFPVFKRHYAGDPAPFALALFLGRPAILVEHHPYFQDGLQGIETFARSLRQTCPSVKWPRLHDLITTTHATRKESDRCTDIRFFTNKFHLDRSKDTTIGSLRFRKRIYDPSSVRSVSIDGQETPFTLESNFLKFELMPHHPSVHDIRIGYAPTMVSKTYSFGPRYQSSVALRRTLSEARDNVLSRHKRTGAVAKKIVEALHLTGSSVRR